MSEKNLWGDLSLTEATDMPSGLLRDQGKKLAELTNGEIRGVVVTTPMVTTDDIGIVEDEPFMLVEFYLRVPGLHDYRHLFLEIHHPPPPAIYPLTVKDVINGTFDTCDDEPAFLDILTRRFQSDEVRKVLSGLLTVSRSNASG